MTLEDAIVYYSEMAKECRRKARIESNDYMDMKDRAYEAEQLSDWLNELKVLRERIDVRKKCEWIPCNERLPHGSCSDLVNVSIHDDSGDTPYDYTSCGWITTDGEYWIVDNEINNHVVAWMPLPKPYRGENDV